MNIVRYNRKKRYSRTINFRLYPRDIIKVIESVKSIFGVCRVTTFARYDTESMEFDDTPNFDEVENSKNNVLRSLEFSIKHGEKFPYDNVDLIIKSKYEDGNIIFDCSISDKAKADLIDLEINRFFDEHRMRPVSFFVSQMMWLIFSTAVFVVSPLYFVIENFNPFSFSGDTIDSIGSLTAYYLIVGFACLGLRIPISKYKYTDLMIGKWQQIAIKNEENHINYLWTVLVGGAVAVTITFVMSR